jgi:hypothetical protein
MENHHQFGVRAHQQVLGSDGTPIGTVDHVDGGRMKLTRADSLDGQHHYLPLNIVGSVEDEVVHLNVNGAEAAQFLDGTQ